MLYLFKRLSSHDKESAQLEYLFYANKVILLLIKTYYVFKT